jgi:hypothetical protein
MNEIGWKEAKGVLAVLHLVIIVYSSKRVDR